MKKKTLQSLLMASGILAPMLASKRKKGSPAFGPEVSKYLGVPHVLLMRSQQRRVDIQAGASVDVANAWALAANKTYTEGDMILIAIREAYQNSFDAIDLAMQKGQITKGQFAVIWQDNKDGTVDLILKDNGIGMSESDIVNRFLKLAGSGGKTQASRGGFGYAKAAILSLSKDFAFTLRTRDLIYNSTDFSKKHKINNFVMQNGREVKLPYMQGTELHLRNINLEYAESSTNMVIDRDLRHAPRNASDFGYLKENERIAQFLSLNIFDVTKYQVSFYTKSETDQLYFLKYKTYGSIDFDFLGVSRDVVRTEMQPRYKQRVTDIFVPSQGLGIQIKGKKDIMKADSPYYFGIGTEALPVAFNIDAIKKPGLFENKMYVVVTIQGQVQFVSEHYMEGKNPFPLLYLNLHPTLKATDRDYPMDLARLHLTYHISDKLRELLKVIKKSTEQVEDVFDAKWYKTLHFDVRFNHIDFSHAIGISPSEEYDNYDAMYMQVGTKIDGIRTSDYLGLLGRPLKWVRLPVFNMDGVDGVARKQVFLQLKQRFSAWSFLFDWYERNKDNYSHYMVFESFLQSISVLYSSDDLEVRRFADKWGIGPNMSQEDARVIEGFIPKAELSFYLIGRDFDSVSYGLCLFMSFMSASITKHSKYARAFLYSFALVRRYAYLSNSFVRPSFYLDHVSTQKVLCSHLEGLFSDDVQSNESVFCNPLFGSAFMRCDYQDDYGLIDELSIVAFTAWTESLKIALALVGDIGLGLSDKMSITEGSRYSGLVFDNPSVERKGRKKDSISMALNRSTWGDNWFLINPEFYRTLTSKTKEAEKVAVLLCRILVHEITHCLVSDHNEQFVAMDAKLFSEFYLADLPVLVAELLPKIDSRLQPARGSKAQIAHRQRKYLASTNFRPCMAKL